MDPGRKTRGDDERVDFKIMADRLMNEFNIVTERKSKEMFMYDEEKGIYQQGADTYIEEIGEEWADADGQKQTTHVLKEILRRIRAKTYVSHDLFNSNPHEIHLANGILDTDTLKTKDFTPTIIATQHINIKFNPDAQCPNFVKFLSEVAEVEDIPLIQEIFGWCLVKEYFPQKWFVFIGGGGNGKTTLLRVLAHFLGKENVCENSPHDLGNDKYAKAELCGKLANIVADISEGTVKYSNIIKELTGDDLIRGPVKWKNPVRFINHAKLIFSGNKMPAFNDDTDAFYRRPHVINFNRYFGPPSQRDLWDATEDIGILHTLLTEPEMEGILIWSLEGLRRLRNNGEFTGMLTINENRELIKKMSGPATSFFKKYLEETDDPTDRIIKIELYEFYCKHGQKHLNRQEFKRYLLSRFKKINTVQLKIPGTKKHPDAWAGLKFKPIKDDKPKSKVKQKKSNGSGEEHVEVGVIKPPDPIQTNISSILGDLLGAMVQNTENGTRIFSMEELKDIHAKPEKMIKDALKDGMKRELINLSKSDPPMGYSITITGINEWKSWNTLRSDPGAPSGAPGGGEQA